MPKIIGTRRDQAKELLRTVTNGPAIFKDSDTQRQYHIWAETWVIPALKQLVPELKEKPVLAQGGQ